MSNTTQLQTSQIYRILLRYLLESLDNAVYNLKHYRCVFICGYSIDDKKQYYGQPRTYSDVGCHREELSDVGRQGETNH
jgi:hypothetical protein